MPSVNYFCIGGYMCLRDWRLLVEPFHFLFKYHDPDSPASWWRHWNLYRSYIIFRLGLEYSSNLFTTSCILSSLSPSPYTKVSNTLTASSPMIDISVQTLFLWPASSIPVAISNLSQVFFPIFPLARRIGVINFQGFRCTNINYCQVEFAIFR